MSNRQQLVVGASCIHDTHFKMKGFQMNAKSKITLTPEQETLLITLYTKAQPGNPLFFDPKAQDILNQVDYDFTRLHVPYKTVILDLPTNEKT
jgi:O-methyltransferase involved in polyketide biosynthesis